MQAQSAAKHMVMLEFGVAPTDCKAFYEDWNLHTAAEKTFLI